MPPSQPPKAGICHLWWHRGRVWQRWLLADDARYSFPPKYEEGAPPARGETPSFRWSRALSLAGQCGVRRDKTTLLIVEIRSLEGHRAGSGGAPRIRSPGRYVVSLARVRAD